MAGTKNYVGLAADGTGKKLLTYSQGGANDEHVQAVALFDKDGNDLLVSTGVPGAADRGLVTRPIFGDNASAATALSALNAAISIPLRGRKGVGLKIVTTAPNFVGTIVPEVSFDGGTTWNQTYWTLVQSTFGVSGFTDIAWVLNSGAETLYYRFLIPGGTTDARVRVSAYTSGTVTATIVATEAYSEVDVTQGKEGTGPAPLASKFISGMDTGGFNRILRMDAKGTQSVYALTTQDMKDSGRNQVNYFMILPILTTAAEVMMSMTGYKSGVAVAATATPAVVTAGKRFRIKAIYATYVATATLGTARFTLRANLTGVGVIGSPLVFAFNIGGPGGTAGMSQSEVIPIPDGMEFPAGTGIAVGLQGFGPTQAAAVAGYAQLAIEGYEY